MNLFKSRWKIISAAVALLVFGAGLSPASEKAVKMKDLPKAVQKTVQEQVIGAKLRGLSKETEHGKVYYEAEIIVNGHTKDILIDSAGAVVEVEEEVAMDSLPQAVKTAILAHPGKVLKVESVTKGGGPAFYEAHVLNKRKTSEIQVSPEGKPIDKRD